MAMALVRDRCARLALARLGARPISSQTEPPQCFSNAPAARSRVAPPICPTYAWFGTSAKNREPGVGQKNQKAREKRVFGGRISSRDASPGFLFAGPRLARIDFIEFPVPRHEAADPVGERG